MLIALFALYLSYAHAGQDFMMFQWDLLLLESGFLAIFLPGGSRIVIWLFRWLAFRYLLMAGAAKLLSEDQRGDRWRRSVITSKHSRCRRRSDGTQRSCHHGCCRRALRPRSSSR